MGLTSGNANCTVLSLKEILTYTCCCRPNGILFTATAGTTEFARRWDPQKGDIVTFKHHGFLQASKRPKFPTIYRIRNDLSWEDVTSNWNDQSQSSASLPPSIRRFSSASAKSKHEKGFWNEPANHKLAFDALATQLGIIKVPPLPLLSSMMDC